MGLGGIRLGLRGTLFAIAGLLIASMLLGAPLVAQMIPSGLGEPAKNGAEAVGSAGTFAVAAAATGSNSTDLANWGGTVLAGTLFLLALVIVLVVIAMFRRNAKEGGK